MLWSERREARAYNRWMAAVDPLAQHMRWNMGPTGMYLVNTPVLGLAEELGLEAHHSILDIGCGRGSLARYLSRVVRFEAPPVAMDVSTVMLRLALQDADEEAPVSLVAGSASSLPFEDNTFDFVIVAHVWKHLDDRVFLHNLFEIERVLRPGGSCVAWEFAPRSCVWLNRANRAILTLGEVKSAHLRGFHVIASAAIDARFAHIRRLQLGPFFWPPIPRVSVRLYKSEA
ncbi:MAG TPA: methyltransferase domain-containing protein [Dehalococcoidia bacterium]|nr:methyltransferase domain-containing protein [Dehalococcoidia bacterium]